MIELKRFEIKGNYPKSLPDVAAWVLDHARSREMVVASIFVRQHYLDDRISEHKSKMAAISTFETFTKSNRVLRSRYSPDASDSRILHACTVDEIIRIARDHNRGNGVPLMLLPISCVVSEETLLDRFLDALAFFDWPKKLPSEQFIELTNDLGGDSLRIVSDDTSRCICVEAYR